MFKAFFFPFSVLFPFKRHFIVKILKKTLQSRETNTVKFNVHLLASSVSPLNLQKADAEMELGEQKSYWGVTPTEGNGRKQDWAGGAVRW